LRSRESPSGESQSLKQARQSWRKEASGRERGGSTARTRRGEGGGMKFVPPSTSTERNLGQRDLVRLNLRAEERGYERRLNEGKLRDSGEFWSWGTLARGAGGARILTQNLPVLTIRCR